MPRHKKAVVVTDETGSEHVFPSALDAAEYLGCVPKTVYYSINLGYRIFGNLVRYAEEEDLLQTDPVEMACMYNHGVTCDDFTKCKQCGWNPNVKRRIHGQ